MSGMVAFGLGDRAHTVDEIERRFEIRKNVSLGDVVLVNHLPIRQLRRELLQFFAFERRDAASAGHAMFGREAAYSRSTHTFTIPRSIGCQPLQLKYHTSVNNSTNSIETADLLFGELLNGMMVSETNECTFEMNKP